jgi:hypothetical protein
MPSKKEKTPPVDINVNSGGVSYVMQSRFSTGRVAVLRVCSLMCWRCLLVVVVVSSSSSSGGGGGVVVVSGGEWWWWGVAVVVVAVMGERSL